MELPTIQPEGDSIRVFIGTQEYLLSMKRETFEKHFAAGERLLRLNEDPGQETFSPAELVQIRHEIVTDAIRFRHINEMPLQLTEEDFGVVGTVRTVFENAEAKFGGRDERAYRLTAITVGVSLEKVKSIIADFDARANL